jgi:hypothetical protein
VKKFDIPEIPYEYVVKAILKIRKVWALEDLDLEDPAIFIGAPRDPVPDASCNSTERVLDPGFDVADQLTTIRSAIGSMTAGEGFCNIPAMNLLHFGTGPLATAFGSNAVLRKNSPLAFEPAVHTVQEVRRLEKPNLQKDGMCRQILERIDYYNEATRGMIPILPCDTAGPWSIATQIWHYEDMLEAIYTAPEVVHGFLDLVTDCMIEFIYIQMERIGRNFCSYDHTGWFYHPKGWYLGDDVMVTVSPAQFREFFMPYNERISREFGGVIYHCCMKHDYQFENMVNTKGFMGFDANPVHNNFDLIEKALSGKGVWAYLNENWEYIDRLRGKAGQLLYASGKTMDEILENVYRLREHLGS